MAVVRHFKSDIPSLFPKTRTDIDPTPHRPRPVEAPDRGDSGESPEARSGEAPDAGEGRMNTMEQEFTHGRSQS